MKSRSVFEPTEKNPKGEIHEDFGIFSCFFYPQSQKTEVSLIYRFFFIFLKLIVKKTSIKN